MAQLSQGEISQAELDAALKQIEAEQGAWAAQAQSQQREKAAVMKAATEKKLRTIILIGQYLQNSSTPNTAYTLRNQVVSPCFFKAGAIPRFHSGNDTRSGASPRHPMNDGTGYERE